MAEQKSVNFRVVYLFSDEGYMKLEPHPPQTRQAKKGLKSQESLVVTRMACIIPMV